MRSDAIRCHPMPSDAIRCDPMRCDLMRCDPIRCDKMRSDAIRHRISSDRIGWHGMASYRIGSPRIASDRMGSHRIASDRIGSHRIALHCIALYWGPARELCRLIHDMVFFFDWRVPPKILVECFRNKAEKIANRNMGTRKLCSSINFHGGNIEGISFIVKLMYTISRLLFLVTRSRWYETIYGNSLHKRTNQRSNHYMLRGSHR